MILNALYDYYNRCGNLAPMGLINKEIAFLIVIDKEGNLINIEDRRSEDKKSCQKFLVVKGSRSSDIKPYLFYDNAEYVLNYTDDKAIGTKDEKKALEKTYNEHIAFKNKCVSLSVKYPDIKEFEAVSLFYANNGIEKIKSNPLWDTIKNSKCNISFLISGKAKIVAENEVLKNEISINIDEHDSQSICLVSGEKTIPVKTSTATSIQGSQATAKLVAFQIRSGYDSYGKEQGANAPISPKAEAAYTTALLTLLDKDSKNKISFGERTFLFWASSNSTAAQKTESCFFDFLNIEKVKDNPNKRVDLVKTAFKSIYSGFTPFQSDDHFFILGLAPNAARIAVVYWAELSIKEFAQVILRHFEDMEISSDDTTKDTYAGLFSILSSVAPLGKISNTAPNLTEAIAKSIFQGTPYPFSLFMQCLNRIKATQSITINRAAIIKAYLNRQNNNNTKKLTIMVDKENLNEGYLCGRLFATLVYIQKIANGIDSIRERYLNAASSTPSSVFSTLLNLSSHHVEKLPIPRQIFIEKVKAEIIDKFTANGFPTHLNLQDQGRFMVGYYHQIDELWTKKDNTSTEDNNEQESN